MKKFVLAAAVVSSVLGTLTYPLAIYLALTRHGARVAGGIVLFVVLLGAALRYRRRPQQLAVALRLPAVVLAVVGLGIVLDDPRYVMATPVLISLALAANFGGSLLGEQPLVERFARLEVADLTPPEVSYCRRVTQIWLAFVLANATLAGVLAAVASPQVWALYTGAIAYVAMGLLFAVEWLVRKFRFRRYSTLFYDRAFARLAPPPGSVRGPYLK